MMEFKEFKSILTKQLKLRGFVTRGGQYYLHSEEVIVVIGLQRSISPGCYYIEVGIVLRELIGPKEWPKVIESHIRSRFVSEAKSGNVHLICHCKFATEVEIANIVDTNLSRLTPLTLSLCGVRELLEQNPILLNVTWLSAKKLLNFE